MHTAESCQVLLNHSMRLAGLALALLLPLASCARPSGRDLDAAPAAGALVAAPGEGSATLIIDNGSIWDVRIFAVRSTQNIRLGTVVSGTTGTFALPAHLLTRELVVLADPVGARTRLRTDTFVARAGDEVKIILEKRLRSYGFSIH
jgi:hypothetical protein